MNNLKRLKLMITLDIFTIALLILSLINLLNNSFLNCFILILFSFVMLAINNNFKKINLNNGGK